MLGSVQPGADCWADPLRSGLKGSYEARTAPAWAHLACCPLPHLQLRKKLRQAFLGGPPKQPTIVHASIARLLSAEQLSREQIGRIQVGASAAEHACWVASRRAPLLRPACPLLLCCRAQTTSSLAPYSAWVMKTNESVAWFQMLFEPALPVAGGVRQMDRAAARHSV